MRMTHHACGQVLEPGIGAGHAHEAACIGERESDRLPDLGRNHDSTAVPGGDTGSGHLRGVSAASARVAALPSGHPPDN